MIDEFYHLDTMLEEELSNITNRRREVTETENGIKVTLSKEEVMDFLGWSESTYQNKAYDLALYGRGAILDESEGRDANAKITVTLTNYVWYDLLLNRDANDKTYRRTNIGEEYLNFLFIGAQFMELGGANIAATIEEFAAKYGPQFGLNVGQAKNKIKRVRIPLNKFNYLLNGRRSAIKQIRVKKAGDKNYLQGPRAVAIGNQLSRAYANFYKELNEDNPKRLQALKDEFTAKLKKQHGLDAIYSHRMSVISDIAIIDYNAIIELYLSGATFTEIRSFLLRRVKYWEEQEKMIKPVNKAVKEVIKE
ncbi:hypothetical protein [Priestia flexa]|uniref:hypothetical protein n=1 Tax=Priestia flexa TaxID=86664 RepID=UPI00077C5F94|nr:hypothetical protein [Priestia flexa]MED4588231.1 hypothetical protein [Priestia flexa]